MNPLRAVIAVIVFLLTPMWFALSTIICIGIIPCIYLRAAWRACRPSAPVSANAIPPGPSKEEPAYVAYLAREVYLDARTTVHAAWNDIDAASKKAGATAVRVLIGEQNDSPLMPTLIGLSLGASFSIAFVAAGLAIAAAIFASTLAVSGAVMIMLMLAVGGVERLLVLARGIQISCPYDGGCRRFGLPTYACNGTKCDDSCNDTRCNGSCDGKICDERHSQLSPNRNGVLGHVCRCKTRLPTATVLGRYRLVAYCPSCERPLPSRIGTVPIDHIALVGESAYGKSTLMHMLLGSLSGRVTDNGGSFAFVNHWDSATLETALAKLRSGNRLSPTLDLLPHGVMVDVRNATDPGRILYLFDPAGEVYRGQHGVQSQQYLQKSEHLIILIDPFALPEVRNQLTPQDLERATAKDPLVAIEGRRDPAKLIEDLAATMVHSDRRGRTRRIAVVITKVDALRETSVGERLGRTPDDRRAWLEGLGLWPTLKILDGFGAEVRFFASGLNGISNLEQTEPGQDEILEWCATPANATAKRLSTVFSRLVGSNVSKPRHPGKKRRIPLSYQVGRLIFLGGQVAAVATVPLLLIAFIDWLVI